MKDKLYRLLSRCFFPSGVLGGALGSVYFLLLLFAAYFVDQSGGTQGAYVHVFYIPIVLSGMCFGVIGGLFASILGAFMAGPYMPLSVDPYVEQAIASWGTRSVFFIFVGSLSGLGASVLRDFLTKQRVKLQKDTVTALLNFRGLRERAQHYHQGGKPVSIVFIEIDHLSHIDGAIGTELIEALFKQIAERLMRLVSEAGAIGRLETGGFVLLCPGRKKAEHALEVCKSFLGDSFVVGNVPVFTEFHFGLAEAENVQENFAATLRKAKIASVQSRELQKVSTIFDHHQDAKIQRGVFITHGIRKAIERDELQLFYQPKISLATGDVLGVEALVRWPHHELGMIPPNEFIPVVEKTLLINPYTSWLLKTALKEKAKWLSDQLDIHLSLNFSMKNFQDPEILSSLETLVDQYGLDSRKIEIEVTETAVASSIKKVADILQSLREKGFKIAVDDFGTGQSSLHYLFELPIDSLKIDQIFVRSMMTNSAAEAIVRSSILLAKELNLEVTAEGVETVNEYRMLKKMGCHVGQGFYFARPMPASLAREWLIAHPKIRL